MHCLGNVELPLGLFFCRGKFHSDNWKLTQVSELSWIVSKICVYLFIEDGLVPSISNWPILKYSEQLVELVSFWVCLNNWFILGTQWFRSASVLWYVRMWSDIVIFLRIFSSAKCWRHILSEYLHESWVHLNIYSIITCTNIKIVYTKGIGGGGFTSQTIPPPNVYYNTFGISLGYIWWVVRHTKCIQWAHVSGSESRD